MITSKWIRVTRANPCPICKKFDWCCVGEKWINCMRVQSDHIAKNGGWFHKLDSASVVVAPVPVREKPHINATAMMKEWLATTDVDRIHEFSDRLGVTVWSLLDIGIAWASPHVAWAFPMRDAHGDTIGIRLRSETRKWAVTGSRAGLFFGKKKESTMTCICEGPTDTAAAISIGLDVCGRPSCLGQEQMLCDRLRKSERVLIIADNDDPGIRGAEKLQTMLRCLSLIWCPPCKDLREFVRAGGTAQLLDSLIRPMVWTRPSCMPQP